jgi:hypothetical protein
MLPTIARHQAQEMTAWTATISKLRSDDGFWTIQPGVARVGQEIAIDFDSRRVVKFIHQPTGQEFECEVVDALDQLPGETDMVFPVELLDL